MAAPRIDDFTFVKLISKGGFGKVYLGHKKDDPKKLFAIKEVEKSDIVKKNMCSKIVAERDALAVAKSPFVVHLYYSLQTDENIYLVMEYLVGGDLKSLILNYGCLPESLAVFYAAETALALEYLHSHHIIHRDIKPDNILVCASGHLKLTDFGLAHLSLDHDVGIRDIIYSTPGSTMFSRCTRTPGQLLSLLDCIQFKKRMKYDGPDDQPSVGAAAAHPELTMCTDGSPDFPAVSTSRLQASVENASSAESRPAAKHVPLHRSNSSPIPYSRVKPDYNASPSSPTADLLGSPSRRVTPVDCSQSAVIAPHHDTPLGNARKPKVNRISSFKLFPNDDEPSSEEVGEMTMLLDGQADSPTGAQPLPFDVPPPTSTSKAVKRRLSGNDLESIASLAHLYTVEKGIAPCHKLITNSAEDREWRLSNALRSTSCRSAAATTGLAQSVVDYYWSKRGKRRRAGFKRKAARVELVADDAPPENIYWKSRSTGLTEVIQDFHLADSKTGLTEVIDDFHLSDGKHGRSLSLEGAADSGLDSSFVMIDRSVLSLRRNLFRQSTQRLYSDSSRPTSALSPHERSMELARCTPRHAFTDEVASPLLPRLHATSKPSPLTVDSTPSSGDASGLTSRSDVSFYLTSSGGGSHASGEASHGGDTPGDALVSREDVVRCDLVEHQLQTSVEEMNISDGCDEQDVVGEEDPSDHHNDGVPCEGGKIRYISGDNNIEYVNESNSPDNRKPVISVDQLCCQVSPTLICCKLSPDAARTPPNAAVVHTSPANVSVGSGRHSLGSAGPLSDNSLVSTAASAGSSPEQTSSPPHPSTDQMDASSSFNANSTDQGSYDGSETTGQSSADQSYLANVSGHLSDIKSPEFSRKNKTPSTSDTSPSSRDSPSSVASPAMSSCTSSHNSHSSPLCSPETRRGRVHSGGISESPIQLERVGRLHDQGCAVTARFSVVGSACKARAATPRIDPLFDGASPIDRVKKCAVESGEAVATSSPADHDTEFTQLKQYDGSLSVFKVPSPDIVKRQSRVHKSASATSNCSLVGGGLASRNPNCFSNASSSCLNDNISHDAQQRLCSTRLSQISSTQGSFFSPSSPIRKMKIYEDILEAQDERHSGRSVLAPIDLNRTIPIDDFVDSRDNFLTNSGQENCKDAPEGASTEASPTEEASTEASAPPEHSRLTNFADLDSATKEARRKSLVSTGSDFRLPSSKPRPKKVHSAEGTGEIAHTPTSQPRPVLATPDGRPLSTRHTPMSCVAFDDAGYRRQRRRIGPSSLAGVFMDENDHHRILGTPDYLAPEILRCLPHGSGVDWWALGVCIYEMVLGVAPFSASSFEAVVDNVMQRRLLFPDDEDEEPLSDACVSVISSLLEHDPARRFAMPDVRAHAFFADIAWDGLLSMQPPFVPVPDDAFDTTYFDARLKLQADCEADKSVD